LVRQDLRREQNGGVWMTKYIRAASSVAIASLLLCNYDTALSETTPSLVIEAGNGQTVDQNRSLAHPLQVRLTTTSGRPDPNVGVTFTATRNNGLNDPEIVATTDTGIATWLPGPFRNPGTYTITASAVGYNPASFTVTVNDTPNDYDGTYYCTTYLAENQGNTQEIPSIGAHEFTILNDAISQPDPVPYYDFKGTYDPVAHTISGFIGNGIYGIDFTKSAIVIDAEGTARVNGRFSVAQQDGGLQPLTRNWRCIRE